MSIEELQAEIMTLRQSRRMPPPVESKAKANSNGKETKKKAKMTRAEISELLRSLSGEELQDLVGRMEDE